MNDRVGEAVAAALATEQNGPWFTIQINVMKDGKYQIIAPKDMNMLIIQDFLLSAAKKMTESMIQVMKQQQQKVQPVGAVPPEVIDAMRRGGRTQ